MQNLWTFLVRHFHWLLFLFLEAVSVVMLFNYNSYQGSVWISSANAIAGKCYEWQAQTGQFFSLTRINAELTQRNVFLEQQIDKMREKLNMQGSDNIHLPFDIIPAKVVSNTVNKLDNLITIDKGVKDGVGTDMGVVCGNGIVGVVYLAGDHYAVVLPVLNNRSRISCSIRDKDYFGYLSWSGGDPSRAYLEDVPRHARFRKGDWIETSGYSAIFPHGVTVGQIEKIYNSRDGLSYRLLIHLSTDFSCLRDVCVISDKHNAERMRLQEAARDSLMLLPKSTN